MRSSDFTAGSPEYEYLVRAERIVAPIRGASSEAEILAAIRFLEDKTVYFSDGEAVGPRGFHATLEEIAGFVLAWVGAAFDEGYWANLASREPDDDVRARMRELEERVRTVPEVSEVR